MPRSRSRSKSPKKSKKGSPRGSPISAHCFGCKKSRMMKNPKLRVIKNGRHMMRGKCVKCGTEMCRFVAK